ncbi:MAG TPA: hypothetical protein PL059_14620 [Spirochaetota bacterium]|nr:hypothetical protein [Spirochaetota bacterium]HOM11423.1 hypothetical protein [Spirochaetota bacterium]HPP51202.1 hypothetical protein [Spirochaetota bacterium]HXK65090.1 hypothetical protein [Spirochaetota bacterium]
MNAETTTCISLTHDKILKEICKKYNLSITTIVVLMVKFAVERQKLSIISNRNVKYRNKNCSIWRRIHLQLSPNDYEFLMDVKKIWKISVAKMIEYCIDNVLFELQEKVLEKNKTDNYLYNNYHFEIGEEEGLTYYLIYWGLPLKLLKKLTLQNSILCP